MYCRRHAIARIIQLNDELNMNPWTVDVANDAVEVRHACMSNASRRSAAKHGATRGSRGTALQPPPALHEAGESLVPKVRSVCREGYDDKHAVRAQRCNCAAQPYGLPTTMDNMR